ncbi:MAG: hypothetical protein PHE73_03630 [Sulfurovaceae bacterium]|nr:hypothetical protein [Sulfurovaceae bacterium]
MRTIIGTLERVDGTPSANTKITFTLVNESNRVISSFIAETHEQVYGSAEVTTDENGAFSVSLVENTLLSDETYYLVKTDKSAIPSFRAALAAGAGDIDWLEFKASGGPIEPAVLDIIQTYIDTAEAAATISTTKAGEASLDAEQTALDRIATGEDRVATGLDAEQTALDRIATGEDRVATGLDAEQTALDRIATGEDRTACGESAQIVLDNKPNIDIIAANIDVIENLSTNIDEIMDGIVYTIGTAGQIGFGVSPARKEIYEKYGMIPFEGHTSMTSPNRGKYLHAASGSIFYYIPKHYYKTTVNENLFSDVPIVGYILDRSFINAGVEIEGIFVFGFGGSNNAGKLSARQGYDPVSTNSAHNPISALTGTPANNYGGAYKAVKSCDANACVQTVWVDAMLARLAIAHGKSATTQTACAYMDVNPKHPKGNNNNALKDVNDTSVTFTSSGYSNCALTGSGVPFAKTTHNGQECGIADLNGNMYHVAAGLTYKARTGATGTSGTNAVVLTAHKYAAGQKIAFGGTPSTGTTYNTALYIVDTVVDANNFTLTTNLERNILATDGIYTGKTFYILKESVDMTAILDDSTTAGTGAYDMNLYEQIDLSDLIFDNTLIKLGNGTNQVYGFSTDRSSAAYKRAAIGIPLAGGVSAGGTTEFGDDGLYRYLRHDLAVIAGGAWDNSSAAGVGNVTLYHYRTGSDNEVGVRAYIPATLS